MPSVHRTSGEGAPRRRRDLLDLGFLEVDMLLGDRIVFAFDHFLGHRAAVFLGHVEEAGVSRRKQLDLDGCRLGHCSGPVMR